MINKQLLLSCLLISAISMINASELTKLPANNSARSRRQTMSPHHNSILPSPRPGTLSPLMVISRAQTQQRYVPTQTQDQESRSNRIIIPKLLIPTVSSEDSLDIFSARRDGLLTARQNGTATPLHTISSDLIQNLPQSSPRRRSTNSSNAFEDKSLNDIELSFNFTDDNCPSTETTGITPIETPLLRALDVTPTPASSPRDTLAQRLRKMTSANQN